VQENSKGEYYSTSISHNAVDSNIGIYLCSTGTYSQIATVSSYIGLDFLFLCKLMSLKIFPIYHIQCNVLLSTIVASLETATPPFDIVSPKTFGRLGDSFALLSASDTLLEYATSDISGVLVGVLTEQK